MAQESTGDLPRGVTPGEARLLLQLLARLKAWKYGRLAVNVRDGRLVDIELVEKVDRNLFLPLSADGDADRAGDEVATPRQEG